MKIIYVSGPYTAPTPEGVAANVQAAAAVGQELLRKGWAVVCPHTMTHNWDIGTGLDADVFYRTDLELLRRCDAICMIGDWQKSKGAVGEWDLAVELDIPRYLGAAQVPEVEAA